MGLGPQERKIRIDAEFGDAIRDIAVIVDRLNKMGAGIDRVTDATGKFNKQGARIATTFKSITESGVKLTTTFKRQGAVISNVKTQFSSLGAAIKSIRQDEEALRVARQKAGQEQQAQAARRLQQIKAEADAARRLAQSQQIASRQRLPFRAAETGATVAELNRVAQAQSRLASAVNKSSLSIARSQQIVTRAIREPGRAFTGQAATIAAAARGLNTALTKSGTAAKRFGDAFKVAGEVGKRSGDSVLLSWQSFARLLITQQIHLLISRITFAFRDSIRGAIDFQIQISEIRTIAQDNQLAFGEWSKEVRKLARDFGQTGADVAEAAYQTLSNQVAKGRETFDFLTTALRLSKAATGTTEDAVNLLTSAINSFELQTSAAKAFANVIRSTPCEIICLFNSINAFS